MKTKNLILRVLTIVFSALMFVPMVTGFVVMMQDDNPLLPQNIKLADWKDSILYKNASLITLTKVFYYIVFALAMVLVVLEIVRFVLNKKNNLVELFTKLCAILVLVLSIVVFVLALIWCMTNITKVRGGNPVVYLPWAGGVLTLVFGLIAGICGLKELNEKPKKK